MLVILFFAGLLQAKSQNEIFAPGGRAIKGYDPVAFFTDSKAVMGADSLSYQWHEAKWFFVSRKNLELFKASPEKFAPQYGGYCAYGLSAGHKAPTETETWTVKNDKLYFNYNKDVQKIWLTAQDSLIRKADQNWPDLKDKK